MTRWVVDASVAAKWLLPPARETHTVEAFRLLDQYVKGETSLLVPDLFWPELGNILWKSVRIGRISRDSAEEALVAMADRKIPTAPTSSLIRDAFAIAAMFDQTVYDGVYVGTRFVDRAVDKSFEIRRATVADKIAV